MSLTPATTLNQAIDRGDAVFDILTEFGNSNFNTPTGSTADAMLPPTGSGSFSSIAGIAIGPKSDIDRCWVSYSAGGSLLVSAPGTPLTPSYNYIHCLSVDAPLLFSQPGNAGVVTTGNGALSAAPTMMILGRLAVWPYSGIPISSLENPYGARIENIIAPNDGTTGVNGYTKADGTNVHFAFGARFTSFSCANIAPRLHLQLLLQPIALTSISNKRAPVVYVSNAQPVTTGAERIVLAFPIYGRKSIGITASCNDASTWRAAAIRGLNANVDTFQPDYLVQEVTLGEKTQDTANHSVGFTLCTPCADYLMLYCTPGAGGTTVKYCVTAYD